MFVDFVSRCNNVVKTGQSLLICYMVIGSQEYNVTSPAGFPVSKSTGVVAYVCLRVAYRVVLLLCTNLMMYYSTSFFPRNKMHLCSRNEELDYKDFTRSS